MALYRTSDKIKNVTIKANNVIIDPTDVDSVEIYLYDSTKTLIQQYSYPEDVGFKPLELSGETLNIKIDSADLVNTPLGNISYKRIIKTSDTDFDDNFFNAEYIIDEFDKLIENELS